MAANDNFDLILRRYDEIGARLTEGVAGAEYSALSRELADLEPVVEAIRAFARQGEGARGSRRPAGRPGARPGNARASPRTIAPRPRPRRSDGAGDPASRCCPRTPPTKATSFSRCAREPAATRRRCSPATFSACTSNMPRRRAGRSRLLSMSEGTAGGYKEIVARDLRARRVSRGSSSRAASTASSACPRPRRRGASTPPPRPSRSCRTPRRSISSSTRPTSRSTPCARAAPAASTSTRPNSAIRITHLPTGIVVAMQEERSQHRNRAKAMALLRSRILDAENQQRQRRAGRGAARAGRLGRPLAAHPHLQFPAGTGDRPPDQPDALLLDRMMEGEGLDEIIDALPPSARRELLAAAGA